MEVRILNILLLNITFLFGLALMQAQTISINVSNEINEVVDNASVYLIDVESGKIISNGKTNLEGVYISHIKTNIDSIKVQILHLDYKTFAVIKDIKNDDKVAVFNFILEARKEELKTVLIKARKSISVSKDTITYDVNRFKDGYEKVIEDILRNIPGLKVHNDGSVSYNGQSISNVLINGRKLFDGDYKDGTRNINAEVLKQLQVIKNYSDNKLDQGLKTDRIALNFILTKESLMSLRSEIGHGIDNEKVANANLLWTNRLFSSFNRIAFQNVGQDNQLSTSPFVEYDITSSFSQLIQQSNSLNFDSTSSVMGIQLDIFNEELKIKSNITSENGEKETVNIKYESYFDNRTRNSEVSQVIVLPSGDISRQINNLDHYQPQVHQLRFEHLLYPRSKQSLRYWFDSKLTAVDKKNVNTTNGSSQIFDVSTEDKTLGYGVEHTFKWDSKILKYNVSHVVADLETISNYSSITDQFIQGISSKPYQLNLNTKFIKKYDKSNYSLNTYFRSAYTPMRIGQSDLNVQNNLSKLYRTELGLHPSFIFDDNEKELSVSLNGMFYRGREYVNGDQKKINELIMLPHLSFKSPIFKKIKFEFKYDRNLNFSYIGFSSNVLLNPNYTVRYENNHIPIPSHNFQLRISESDYSKYLEWRTSLSYNIYEKSNVSFNDFNVNQTNSIVRTLNENTYLLSFNNYIEKYIRQIKGNISLGLDVSNMSRLNTIGLGSEVTKVTLWNTQLTGFYKRKLNKQLYLKTGVEMQKTIVESEESNQDSNFQYQLKSELTYDFESVRTGLEYSYIKSAQDFRLNLLTLNIDWSPKKVPIAFSLTGSNLLNIEAIEIVQIDPNYSSRVFTQVAPRRLYISASYNF